MKYRFEYTDGSVREREFKSATDAREWAHMDGDHLLDYYKVVPDNTKVDWPIRAANARSSRR